MSEQARVTIDQATMQPQHPMRQHALPDEPDLVAPLPSKAITAANNKTATAVDATGRKITVKRVSAIGFYRLAKMMGAEREKRMGAGRELGLLDEKGHATFLTNGRPDFMKVLDIASERAAKIPIERRAGVERAYFGTQGAGALAVLGDPVVRAQITALKKELDEFRTGADFFEKYGAESPAQKARTAFADLSNVLTDIGENVLPPITSGFKVISALLEKVKGNKVAEEVTTAAVPGIVGTFFGGPILGAVGAAWGLGMLLNHGIDAVEHGLGNMWPSAGQPSDAATPGKTSFDGSSPPRTAQPIQIQITTTLDGQKVGESVINQIVQGGKGAIGGSPYYDPSTGPVPFDLLHSN
jgi:hypothetical protein